MNLRFWKLQSIGNDFPLVCGDDIAGDFPLDQVATRLCDRKFGVGGDGLLVLSRKSSNTLLLRMFNPDGSEDFCGNGLRCAARYAIDHEWVAKRFAIEHLDQTVSVEVSESVIRTTLGKASYDPRAVPLERGTGELFLKPVYWSDSKSIVGSALTTGSTHVVIPVDDLPSDEDFLELGPKIEHFGLYPERTSVIWRKVVDRDSIKIRIWERGVGETLGCGTGSSAAAMDYLRSENRGGRIFVANPGGDVSVEAESWNGSIIVQGEAFETFAGQIEL
jgi:diaminopimelate epimerase